MRGIFLGCYTHKYVSHIDLKVLLYWQNYFVNFAFPFIENVLDIL